MNDGPGLFFISGTWRRLLLKVGDSRDLKGVRYGVNSAQ